MSSKTVGRMSTPRSGQRAGPVSYSRVVVKAGTTLLTGQAGDLNLQMMASLVQQIALLHKDGVETILVSSGAVAAGRQALGLKRDGRDEPLRQVLAAAGQGKLLHAYEQLFDEHQVPIAQALLSRKDLTDRLGYLNVRNTLLSLLELQVIPVVNENDVVSVEELTGEVFGDNDNLSAMVANIVDADLLVMLGDVDGLFTSDPNLDSKAKLIREVQQVDEEVEVLAGSSWDNRGRGGMATKLEAAGFAAASGVDVVIASGRAQDVLPRLASGIKIGTYFPATSTKMESRKRWMLSGLCTVGEIMIDDGASIALREGCHSLLAAGIKEVLGSFQRGDIVSVLDGSRDEIAVGIANYDSDEMAKVMGRHSKLIEEVLGHHYGDEMVHRNNMVTL